MLLFVLIVDVDEYLAAWYLGAQLDTGQEGATQLAVQRVCLLWGCRQSVLWEKTW